MTDLTNAAWVLHDLGAAAGFGGNLFGMLALNPAVKVVEDERERGRLVQAAWDRYRIVNAISLVCTTGTWLAGRLFLSGREVSAEARTLTTVKDALVAGSTVTGVAGLVLTSKLSSMNSRDEQPIFSGLEPSPEAKESQQRLQKTANAVGALNLVFTAGVIGVTAWLAMSSGKSSRWSFISRMLP